MREWKAQNNPAFISSLPPKSHGLQFQGCPGPIQRKESHLGLPCSIRGPIPGIIQCHFCHIIEKLIRRRMAGTETGALLTGCQSQNGVSQTANRDVFEENSRFDQGRETQCFFEPRTDKSLPHHDHVM